MLRNIFSAAMLAVMLVILVAGNAQAQSATVTATANVLANLTVDKTDVTFANITSTTTAAPFLDPVGTANAHVGSGSTAGSVHIYGPSSATDIRITWPAQVSLAYSTYTLNYALSVSGSTGSTQGSSSPVSLTLGWFNTTTASTGDYYLWVGGYLGGSGTSGGALSSQHAGSYVGTALFTVEYN